MNYRTSIALLFFMTVFLAVGKNNDKDFIKLIEKHDVPAVARNLSKDKYTNDFWDAVLENNPIISKLYKDMSKGKGAEKEAMQNISRMKLIDPYLEVDIVDELRGYCDTMAINMGIPVNLCKINVIFDNSVNAFTALTNDGFAIFLNTGLLEALNYDYDRIVGIATHEFAHGALMHHLRTEYEVTKKNRRDKVLAGITAGLNAVAAGADAYTSATLGTESHSDVYAENINKLKSDMASSSLKFRYKYNRSEELEADLIAFRFLDWLGVGNKYIEALQILNSKDSYFWYNDESDHPSTGYRIEFLSFVKDHPEYGFKDNPKR